MMHTMCTDPDATMMRRVSQSLLQQLLIYDPFALLKRLNEFTQSETKPFAATATLFGVNEAELYREDGVFVQCVGKKVLRRLMSTRMDCYISLHRNPTTLQSVSKELAQKQPGFGAAHITALLAHMAAELVAPTTPPYIVRDNKILLWHMWGSCHVKWDRRMSRHSPLATAGSAASKLRPSQEEQR
uniref:Uncharacterized protein n=1 Tax=Ascaris lumbricoides TaxID=6252 RepID=A0A0M3INY6_ASCLU